MSSSNTSFNVKNGLTVNSNLIVASNGLVGINNASPTYPLTVSGNTYLDGTLSFGGGQANLVAVTNATIAANLSITNNGRAAFGWNFANAGETDLFLGRKTGNGGINIFDVNGTTVTPLTQLNSNLYNVSVNTNFASSVNVGSGTFINSSAVITGNLTGTLGTGSQLSITQVGILASLVVNGTVTSNTSYLVGNASFNNTSLQIGNSTVNSTLTQYGLTHSNGGAQHVSNSSLSTISDVGSNNYLTLNTTSIKVSGNNSGVNNFVAINSSSIAGGALVVGGAFGDLSQFANGDQLKSYYGTIGSTGKTIVGWNISSGGGEFDLIVNRGAGSNGGLNIYDLSSTVGANVRLLSSINTNNYVVVVNTFFAGNLNVFGIATIDNYGNIKTGNNVVNVSVSNSSIWVQNGSAFAAITGLGSYFGNGFSNVAILPNQVIVYNATLQSALNLTGLSSGNSTANAWYTSNNLNITGSSGLNNTNINASSYIVNAGSNASLSLNANLITIANSISNISSSVAAAYVSSGNSTTYGAITQTVVEAVTPTSSATLASDTVFVGNSTANVTLYASPLFNSAWAGQVLINGSPIMLPGFVQLTGGTYVPPGWVECNGQYLLTSAYPGLYAMIGTSWGVSGLYFAVPDLRGAFVRGWDHGRTLDNGRGFASYQADSQPNHYHNQQGSFTCGSYGVAYSVPSVSAKTVGSYGGIVVGTAGALYNGLQNIGVSSSGTVTIGGTTSYIAAVTGGGITTEIVPKNYAMMYIIKT